MKIYKILQHKEWILICAIKKNHLECQRILGCNKYCDSKALYIYTRIKQLSEWVADERSEVSLVPMYYPGQIS